MGTCSGSFTWDQIDSALRGAQYPGPYDHGQAELAAYTSAAGCTPSVGGYSGGQMSADCSPTGVQVWASGIQLPTCVGTAFCAAYGRLPQSIPELVNWGNSTGYRSASGAWNCTGNGSPAPAPAPAPVGTYTPPASGLPATSPGSGTGSGAPSTSILPTTGAGGLNVQQLLIPGAVLAAVLLLKK